MKTKFKVGDWVVHNFELYQITELNNKHCELSNGVIRTSFNTRHLNDFLREATSKTKYIANAYEDAYRALYKDFGHTIRNWPDLNRWFSSHCIAMIDAVKDEKELEILDRELTKTCETIREECQKIQERTICGIQLFKR